MIFKRLRSLLLPLAVCLPLGALAGPYSNLFVFGDSLSDSGNNYLAGAYDPTQSVSGNTYIPSYTYDRGTNSFGTYSNGPTWVSSFASALGLNVLPSLLGGTNYAFGGAQTSIDGPPQTGGFPYSLTTQVGQYLGGLSGPADSGALYVVAGGGNNARAAAAALAQPGLSQAQQLAIIAANAFNFATDIGKMVDALQAAGAKNIIVWNAPNLGLTPFAGATGGQGVGAFLAQTMNAQLGLELADEIDVKIFDLYGQIGNIFANPWAYNLTNVTDACGAAINNCDPATALFWDGIHPTAAGHQILAGAMLVAAVPEPSGIALFGLAIFALAVVRRRNTA